MGNALRLRRNYKEVERREGLNKEPETNKEGTFDDSCVEEIDNIEDRHDDGSVAEEDAAAKMLNSLSLSADCYQDDVPLHKNLLESAHRYNPKLHRLQSDIQVQETLWESLRLEKKPQEEKAEAVDSAHLRDAFVPLDKEEEEAVAKAFSNSNRRKVLVSHNSSNIEITGQVLQCLRPRAWLNDEVINLYLELLKERENREPKKFLRCHFFNTFFYKEGRMAMPINLLGDGPPRRSWDMT